VGAALLAVTLVGPGSFDAARAGTPPPGREDRIRQIERQLGEVSRDQAVAIGEYEQARARRQEHDRRVAALDRQVAGARARLTALDAEVTRLRARTIWFAAQRDDARRRFQRARSQVRAAAVELYVNGDLPIGSTSYLVTDTSDPLEATAQAAYVEVVSGARRTAADRLDAARARLARLARTSERERAAVAEARAAADAQRAHLLALRADQRAARDEALAREREESSLVARLRARAADYQAELAALQVTSNAITAMLQARQAGQVQAATFRVIKPAPGPITSGFGYRMHPILHERRLHAGIDIGAPYGATVVAGAAGVVAWAGPRSGYGNTIVVDHGGRYATLYAHLSRISVGTGARVAQGAMIGAVGATGLATGPHLHFEVRRNGVPVDPMAYL
jgi:murein DD-endopeptidase MepM/ murein hydrolase activator NlpD